MISKSQAVLLITLGTLVAGGGVYLLLSSLSAIVGVWPRAELAAIGCGIIAGVVGIVFFAKRIWGRTNFERMAELEPKAPESHQKMTILVYVMFYMLTLIFRYGNDLKRPVEFQRGLVFCLFSAAFGTALIVALTHFYHQAAQKRKP